MKSLKSFLIAMVLLLVSLVAVEAGKLKEASLKLDVVIVEQNNGKVLVGFYKKPTEAVRINIYDSDGFKLYSERVAKGKVMLKRFDMSQLPDGDYSYEVTNRVYSEEKIITK
ncbi:hypothetical protein [Reichenbachiella versicolor]|uniref:hypothetical protein n=1 Tax=Reichenbachiella versicolor TaxID=1821036 RepID=UPI000D6E88B8|nr:hypothetical protein [Reichenbachiella versicolor]